MAPWNDDPPGLQHALNLEDLSVTGKALELLTRSLMHPRGEGYQQYLDVGNHLSTLSRLNTLMQAWPYSMRVGSHNFK